MTTELTEDMTDDDVVFVSGTQNPGALEDAVREMTEGETGPKVEEPLDGPVTLPGGFRRMVTASPLTFENVTDVWVNELDGYAEERIAKARLREDYNAFLNAILESGVERIGNKAATPEDIHELLAGDREYLLLAISIATYGQDLDFTGRMCSECGETFDLSITKDEIPVVRLDNPEDQFFTFTTKRGRVLNVHLPTVSDQAKGFDSETGAEATTLLLAQVVDEFAGDAEKARKMSILDRTNLMEELGKRTPGPRYNGVKFPHEPGCGSEVRLAVGLPDLFPSL